MQIKFKALNQAKFTLALRNKYTDSKWSIIYDVNTVKEFKGTKIAVAKLLAGDEIIVNLPQPKHVLEFCLFSNDLSLSYNLSVFSSMPYLTRLDLSGVYCSGFFFLPRQLKFLDLSNCSLNDSNVSLFVDSLLKDDRPTKGVFKIHGKNGECEKKLINKVESVLPEWKICINPPEKIDNLPEWNKTDALVYCPAPPKQFDGKLLSIRKAEVVLNRKGFKLMAIVKGQKPGEDYIAVVFSRNHGQIERKADSKIEAINKCVEAVMQTVEQV